MAKVVRIYETGGPEVMRWEDVEIGEPGEGQARVRHTAVGVNFLDTYHRSGLYPLPLPSGLGSEAAGVVEAVGPGVTVVRPGDRVAYAGGPPGSYAEARVLPAGILVRIPGRRDRPDGRGRDAQGYDLTVPDPPDISRQGGRDRSVPRRRRWSRADRLPVAESARGDGDRHGGFRREGGGGSGPRMRPCGRIDAGGYREDESARSPAGRASPWSTTRSARTRSWRPSTA